MKKDTFRKICFLSFIPSGIMVTIGALLIGDVFPEHARLLMVTGMYVAGVAVGTTCGLCVYVVYAIMKKRCA